MLPEYDKLWTFKQFRKLERSYCNITTKHYHISSKNKKKIFFSNLISIALLLIENVGHVKRKSEFSLNFVSPLYFCHNIKWHDMDVINDRQHSVSKKKEKNHNNTASPLPCKY